jgi:diaminohydroxyphosphoribosylaminopyrimidine deaminase / 5-amino-6-(5-phosphoribosylamino)uracil reductase
MTHEQYMRRALALARRGEGRTAPNPPVGAVVIAAGEIVGAGFHPGAGQPHAEIFALRQAGERARGADLYVTLEPCCHQGRTGPCTEAILQAGIGRVLAGCIDPNPRVAGQGLAALRQQGVMVEEGVLEKECRRLIAPFAKHVTTGLPYVILKAAMTLDGRIATATGHSRWISGEASRRQVHRLRDRIDAIMVGIGTVQRDDPLLTTRLPRGGRDPLRVVVDGTLRISEHAAILHLQSVAPTLIATTVQAPKDKVARLVERGIEILYIAEQQGRVDLTDLLRQLAARGVQSLLLEGGGTINAAALQAGLVDRVMIFVAPRLLGGEGLGLFRGAGPLSMDQTLQLTDVRVRRFADDVLIEGEIAHCLPG